MKGLETQHYPGYRDKTADINATLIHEYANLQNSAMDRLQSLEE